MNDLSVLARLAIGLSCSLTTITIVCAEEPDSASDSKPAIVKLSGVFESIDAREITAGTDQIKSLKIKKRVAHGTPVKKGQNVVWFDTEDVDKKIKEASTTMRLSELTFQDEEFAYRQFLESQQLDRQAAERTFQAARQAYDNYVQVDHEREIESAEFSLKRSRASMENAQEELKQLEQMYKEDDLTEESEEIVLKRAKQSAESAEFSFRGAEIAHQRSLNQSIPRSKAEQEAAFTRAQLAHAKSIRDLNTAKQKRQIDRQQKQDKFAEEQENFKSLQAERKQLAVASPIAGIAIHGAITRGKLSDKPSTLEENSTVTNEQVLMTIVDANRFQIRVDLAETELNKVSVGAKGKVSVTGYPQLELSATVKSVSTVAFAGTKYDCVLSVKLPKGNTKIMPGMTCSIELTHEDSDGK